MTDTYRIQPQQTDLYLSVFQPRTVLACLANGSLARGDRVIPFDTVSSGSYLAVEPGMTLLVGTSAGARDLGKIRVKSITSSQIVVSENSHINWADNVHLTVLRYFELYPVYPRIINDPADDENVIFYKDYDEAYTDQNTVLGALLCAGSHKAGFAGEELYFSASGTTHLVPGTTITYDWAFEGGSSITGSTSHTPGNVRFDDPGHYVVRLIATGSNGSVDTTYRYVSIYNKEENSAINNPVKNWSTDGVSGGRGEGGSRTSITITQEDVDIEDGSVVVIFADDWYGSTNQSLGGNAVGGSKIFFAGHVLSNTIRFDRLSSSYSFEAGTISELMKITETFSISLESEPSPTKWFQMSGINAKRGIYHYLRWHSTTLSLADFEFVGTDQNVQFFDADRTSVFDAVDNYMRNALLGEFGCDRQGKLWAEVGTSFYSDPTGSFTPQLSITRGDWMGQPTITENVSEATSFIEVGGVAYSGDITGTFSAHLSQAPGATPSGRGKPENLTSLTISGQTQLNLISGNLLAEKNAQFPSIEMDMTCGFRNLDAYPLKVVGVDILPEDNSQEYEIHAPYFVDTIDWKYSAGNHLLLPSLGLKAIVNGTAGETLTIPDVPDAGGFGGGLGVGGGGFKFNPVGYPASFGGFGGARYWTGYTSDTFDVPVDPPYWALFTNFTYLEGDQTLVNNTGANPILLVSGIYLVKIYLFAADSDQAGASYSLLYTTPSTGLDGQYTSVVFDAFLGWVGEKVNIAFAPATTTLGVAIRPPHDSFTVACTIDIVKLG